MSTPDERKEVLAWFGAASYYAQCLEVELSIVLMLMSSRGSEEPTAAEWERIEAERHTMGGLLRFVKNGLRLEDNECKILTQCLERRNYLAHDFWYERSHLLATSGGCRKAQEELEGLCDLFKSGDATAANISQRLRVECGISESLVQRIQQEFVSRLHAGEPQETIFGDMDASLRQLSARGRTGKSSDDTPGGGNQR